MRQILILGAGTYAEEVAVLANESSRVVVGFAIDQIFDKTALLNMPVKKLKDWNNAGNVLCLAAIVSPKRQEIIVRASDLEYEFTTLIHSSASVAITTSVTTGVIVNRQVSVGTGAYLGPWSIINRSASVGHHAQVGAFSTIGPGAILCGNVTIESFATIGAGAVIRENLTVGGSAIVGMGAVVLQDVPPGETWVGNPARKLR